MSEQDKVAIDLDALQGLHEVATRNGTLPGWGVVALQWAGAANAEIADLRSQLAQARAKALREALAALRHWDDCTAVEAGNTEHCDCSLRESVKALRHLADEAEKENA